MATYPKSLSRPKLKNPYLLSSVLPQVLSAAWVDSGNHPSAQEEGHAGDTMGLSRDVEEVGGGLEDLLEGINMEAGSALAVPPLMASAFLSHFLSQHVLKLLVPF